MDYSSCSGSQYWVQAVPGPSSRGYAINPAFSETGAATFSGCSGEFHNVQSAEECAEAARKLYGHVGEVGVQKNGEPDGFEEWRFEIDVLPGNMRDLIWILGYA